MALVAGIMKYHLSGGKRPVAPAFIPQLGGGFTLLADVGLNTDCNAEQLHYFAELSATYLKKNLHIPDPRIALLNIGAEEGKGNQLMRSVFNLFQKNPSFNFIGNIEGNDIITNKADIIICDGYTGNIALKLIESFAVLDEKFSFEKYGGTILLGLTKPVILGHGRSSAGAFKKMIEQAFISN
jgi:glycerol-3-phosphate acyltransferase PlsX